MANRYQGNLLEVADPVMIQTGLFDSTGKNEVVLPAIHSVRAPGGTTHTTQCTTHDTTMTVSVSHHTARPFFFCLQEYVIEFGAGNFNFNVVWYEGDDGIGFFPGMRPRASPPQQQKQ